MDPRKLGKVPVRVEDREADRQTDKQARKHSDMYTRIVFTSAQGGVVEEGKGGQEGNSLVRISSKTSSCAAANSSLPACELAGVAPSTCARMLSRTRPLMLICFGASSVMYFLYIFSATRLRKSDLRKGGWA